MDGALKNPVLHPFDALTPRQIDAWGMLCGGGLERELREESY